MKERLIYTSNGNHPLQVYSSIKFFTLIKNIDELLNTVNLNIDFLDSREKKSLFTLSFKERFYY